MTIKFSGGVTAAGPIKAEVNIAPVWTTIAGTVGSFEELTDPNFQFEASDPEGGSLIYSLISGSLPTGLSLSSSGLLSGTASDVGEDTTSGFTLRVTDEGDLFQDRTFSMEITNLIPWASQQAKIQSSDVEAGDFFGESVSISSDGNTAIIGAASEDTGGSAAGAAYVFTRSGSTWTQQAKIQSSDVEAGDNFGNSVSLSSDGNTVIVGVGLEDTGGNLAGSAYIFTRSGSSWSQQAKIQSNDIEAGDRFGRSVSISSDGNTVIIGARLESTGGFLAGAAYVFTRSGSSWTQQAKIQSSDIGSNDRFGYSVSISLDGNTVIIGATLEDTGGPNAGAAYVFTRSGSTWTQQAKIQSTDKEAGDQFGTSISISSDGNSVIVGVIKEDTGGSDAGSAYVFTRSGSSWTQQAKIQSTDIEEFDRFGGSVSISADGNTVIIGSTLEDTGGINAGAAYVFTRSDSSWTQQAKIQSSDVETGDQFGFSVSMSSDGNTAIIGANAEDTGGSNAGSAYIFIQ